MPRGHSNRTGKPLGGKRPGTGGKQRGAGRPRRHITLDKEAAHDLKVMLRQRRQISPNATEDTLASQIISEEAAAWRQDDQHGDTIMTTIARRINDEKYVLDHSQIEVTEYTSLKTAREFGDILRNESDKIKVVETGLIGWNTYNRIVLFDDVDFGGHYLVGET